MACHMLPFSLPHCSCFVQFESTSSTMTLIDLVFDWLGSTLVNRSTGFNKLLQAPPGPHSVLHLQGPPQYQHHQPQVEFCHKIFPTCCSGDCECGTPTTPWRSPLTRSSSTWRPTHPRPSEPWGRASYSWGRSSSRSSNSRRPPCP